MIGLSCLVDCNWSILLHCGRACPALASDTWYPDVYFPVRFDVFCVGLVLGLVWVRFALDWLPFCFVSFRFVSFRFVSFRFVSFRFVSFRVVCFDLTLFFCFVILLFSRFLCFCVLLVCFLCVCFALRKVFTEGQLMFVDWNNVVAAGGSVLAATQPPPSGPLRDFYHTLAYRCVPIYDERPRYRSGSKNKPLLEVLKWSPNIFLKMTGTP